MQAKFLFFGNDDEEFHDFSKDVKKEVDDPDTGDFLDDVDLDQEDVKNVMEPFVEISTNDSPYYECYECDKIFKSQKAFESHVSQFHKRDANEDHDQNDASLKSHKNLENDVKPSILDANDSDSDEDSQAKTKKHKCEHCKKSFSTTSYLKKHISVVHEGNRDFQCDRCDKTFGSQSGLRVHVQNVHEKAKEFPCDMCDKSFGEISKLQRHVSNVHQGAKKHSCDKCGKCFAELFKLRNHVATVHEGLKQYKCDQCEKVFKEQKSLRNHITTIHEGIKKYRCDRCGKSFTQLHVLHR